MTIIKCLIFSQPISGKYNGEKWPKRLEHGERFHINIPILEYLVTEQNIVLEESYFWLQLYRDLEKRKKPYKLNIYKASEI